MYTIPNILIISLSQMHPQTLSPGRPLELIGVAVVIAALVLLSAPTLKSRLLAQTQMNLDRDNPIVIDNDTSPDSINTKQGIWHTLRASNTHLGASFFYHGTDGDNTAVLEYSFSNLSVNQEYAIHASWPIYQGLQAGALYTIIGDQQEELQMNQGRILEPETIQAKPMRFITRARSNDQGLLTVRVTSRNDRSFVFADAIALIPIINEDQQSHEDCDPECQSDIGTEWTSQRGVHANVAAGANFVQTATCPIGDTLLAGGCDYDGITVNLNTSAPSGNKWLCRYTAQESGTVTTVAHVLCQSRE